MLKRASKEDVYQYLEFVYALAQRPETSGYPTYTDGIKTREDFACALQRGVSGGNREGLLYLHKGQVMGWIQFFTLPEDFYLQTEIFNITEGWDLALQEFTEYCANAYPGYTLYLGFPGDNREAVHWLEKHGWICLEKSWNDVACLKQCGCGEAVSNVIAVTSENFEDFRMLHSRYEDTMYWNSDRLYSNLDEWQILIYYENGCPVGAVYAADCGSFWEVFGLDFVDERFQPDVYRGLLRALIQRCEKMGKKYIVFFNDDQGQELAMEAGFTCIGEYVLYIKTLSEGKDKSCG